MQPVGWNAEHRGKLVLLPHRAAGTGIERVAPGGGIVGAERGARLHRHAGDAADMEFPLHDMRGLRKGTIGRRGIAERRIDRHIVRHFIPDRRCIGPHRVFRMQHERQFLVGHLHRFRRVHRLRFGFGHHHGDGLADMARFVRRQQQMRTDENRAAAGRRKLHVELGLRQRIVRNWLEVVRGAIGAGEYAKHARHRLGLLRIDCDDARVRIRRSHHRRIGLAFETEIVGETAVAGNEPRVLLARHRLADEAVAGLVRPCFVVHRSSPQLLNGAATYCAPRISPSPPQWG